MMIYFGKVITMGFEPTIFWFVVRRLIRWATRPVLWGIKIRGTPEPGFMTTQKMTRQLYKWIHVSCDGRVVKALDLKSNGIFPRRFEPYSQRYFLNRFPLLVVQQEPYLMCQISLAAMAEWLRRLTRNQMGSSRVGSNPTRSVCWFHLLMNLKISPRPVHCRGIEPRSPAWQARILPLNQQCLCSGVNDIWVTTWVSFSIQ